MGSTQTSLILDEPVDLAPNCYIRLDRDLLCRDLFHILDSDGWKTGSILEFGQYAEFKTVSLASDLGYETDDPNLAIAYLNQSLARPVRRLPGWRFALKPSALIMEFDPVRADHDYEEQITQEDF